MDDFCAVCADTLECVVYGACGHREVCSTCVARLRVICDVRRCCICNGNCDVVFVTKKLYSRSQLNQHISTGDSELDGSESERGGFAGHPMCEFCKTPFYGDNELYTHISTEHYTCFICLRQHPGQYEHFKDYDDLEIHFREEHFLCEEACLAKKFIVFQSEAEMKRHNTLERGGRMSRAKRNAALQGLGNVGTWWAHGGHSLDGPGQCWNNSKPGYVNRPGEETLILFFQT